MVKHNNVIPNGHFKKLQSGYIKTWFNQPARKQRRRHARELKAAAVAPAPIKHLRPVVHGQTIRYSAKLKKGRGFSFAELKKAGLTAAYARSIGISVDHRRKNRSAETLQDNVQRLEGYKSRLTFVDQKPKAK
jgi:large subunit ribosomal protein L13e